MASSDDGSGAPSAFDRTNRSRDGPAAMPGSIGFQSGGRRVGGAIATFRGPVRRSRYGASDCRHESAACCRSAGVIVTCISFSASANVVGRHGGAGPRARAERRRCAGRGRRRLAKLWMAASLVAAGGGRGENPSGARMRNWRRVFIVRLPEHAEEDDQKRDRRRSFRGRSGRSDRQTTSVEGINLPPSLAPRPAARRESSIVDTSSARCGQDDAFEKNHADGDPRPHTVMWSATPAISTSENAYTQEPEDEGAHGLDVEEGEVSAVLSPGPPLPRSRSSGNRELPGPRPDPGSTAGGILARKNSRNAQFPRLLRCRRHSYDDVGPQSDDVVRGATGGLNGKACNVTHCLPGLVQRLTPADDPFRASLCRLPRDEYRSSPARNHALGEAMRQARKEVLRIDVFLWHDLASTLSHLAPVPHLDDPQLHDPPCPERRGRRSS